MTDSLLDLLDAAVRAYPDRVAIADPGRALTYRRLGAVVARTAAALRRAGVGPGDPVALLGPRDARLLALLHGILAAGATVVAVDPAAGPTEVRRRWDTAGVRIAVTADALLAEPDRVTVVVDVDGTTGDGPTADSPTGDGPGSPPEAGPLAYLSFTSGSSGRPKAVAVTHANAVHYARALAARLGLSAARPPRCAHVTTLGADLGHTAWLLALATAGTVRVVPDAATRDAGRFWSELGDATLLKTTPSHLAALLPGRPAGAAPIGTLLLGGEQLTRSFAERLFADGVAGRLVNHYGPTETTVGATCFVAGAPADLPPDEPAVPIGTGLGGTLTYLLDGELHIGGPGVSAGYPHLPEETARRFPRHDGRVVYRTGDRCRLRPDGNLVFLGRTDRQVKIRGFRVDPAEVEAVLTGCDGVEQAAVVVRDTPAGRHLIGAVRTSGPALDAARRHLREHLPAYAVPQILFDLDVFPTDATGKLDRPALERLLQDRMHQRAARAGTDAASPLIGEIAALWAEALGLPRVTPDADVRDLGGDSILAIRTVALLHRLGHTVAFQDFYDHPSAAGLAAAARPATRTQAQPPAATRPALAPAQRWLLGTPLTDPRRWNQAVLLRCGRRVDPRALTAAVRAVLDRHPVLRRPILRPGPGPARETVDPVSFSALPADPRTLEELCTELQHSMDPAAGRLLRIHLFTGGPGTDDRLALIAHHLAVDGLSWRILLDDLAHAYRAARDGRPAALAPTGDFYRWAGTQPAVPRTERTAAVTLTTPRALDWTLSPAATARLTSRFGRAQELEALLLSAFAGAVRAHTGVPAPVVEVETHGRPRDSPEHLETVGWFTAVKHVTLGAGQDVARALREAPEQPFDAPAARPLVGFNFLGTFAPPVDDSLKWTVAPEQPGAARCPSGDPLALLRLTGRIVRDRLVCDLVNAAPRVSGRTATAIAEQVSREVAAAAHSDPPPVRRVRISTSGHPMHAGQAAPPGPAITVRQAATVLLTGATGFLGQELVRAFTDRGDQVVCLVREPGAEPVRRPGVLQVPGDLTDPDPVRHADDLPRVRACDLVVHAAADTRLVASPDELDRVNHRAVRDLLSWMDRELPGAALHHLSTLAVAGDVDGAARRFSEADLHIGQHFRTPYERAKFHAEEAVREWAAGGRRCYVYRSGHIAAHSRTGAFRRDAGDNRIYQMIRGYLAAGAAPHRPAVGFRFSHVDTVADAIAAIAGAPQSAPGVYHLESGHRVGHDDLVRWTAAHGYPVGLTSERAFAAAVAGAGRAAWLAQPWSRMDEHRILVDLSYTTDVLRRLGLTFAVPDRWWWGRALDWAASRGHLPEPAVPAAHRE